LLHIPIQSKEDIRGSIISTDDVLAASASNSVGVDQAHSTFYVLQAPSAKSGLYVGNMKFNTLNKSE
jgi:hypothetical protein